jgi:hypothetical protein
VVCYGLGCMTKLTGVHLKDCTLVVMEGAHASLIDTTFYFGPSSQIGLGIYASGRATHVTMTRGCVTGALQAALVTGGASLEASDIANLDAAWKGVEVHGANSSLQITSCTIRVTCPASGSCRPTGVLVAEGSCACMSGVSMSSMDLGVVVSTSAKLHADHVSVQHCGCAAVLIKAGARAKLSRWRVSESANGIQVTQKGCLWAKGCVVSGTSASAQHVGLASEAIANDCLFENSETRSGVQACGEHTVVALINCIVRGNDRYGVLAMDEAMVSVRGCSSKGNKKAAFAVRRGGTMSVRGSSSSDDGMDVRVRDQQPCRHKLAACCNSRVRLQDVTVNVDGVTKSGTLG